MIQVVRRSICKAELDAAKMGIPEAHEDTIARSFEEDKQVGFEKSKSHETSDVSKSSLEQITA